MLSSLLGRGYGVHHFAMEEEYGFLIQEYVKLTTRWGLWSTFALSKNVAPLKFLGQKWLFTQLSVNGCMCVPKYFMTERECRMGNRYPRVHVPYSALQLDPKLCDL
jgi:hypothetical protein